MSCSNAVVVSRSTAVFAQIGFDLLSRPKHTLSSVQIAKSLQVVTSGDMRQTPSGLTPLMMDSAPR